MLGDSILDAALKTYQPLDVEGAITGAQKIEGNQQSLDAGNLALKQQEEVSPLQTALAAEQAKNSLLYNAMAKSPDAATWDQNLRDISQQYPEAAQYIGRYTPVLQQRLLSVYGGQPGSTGGVAPGSNAGAAGASSASPSENMDYQFAQTTPQQRATSLQKLGTFSEALEQVSDENSWNAMRYQLDKAGIPLMDQLGDYSPIKAASLYQKVQPILQYLQGRVVQDQAGAPSGNIAPKIQAVGNSLYAVNPATGQASLQATAPAAPGFASGGMDLSGNPVIFNKATGQRTGQNDGTFGFDDFAKRMNLVENSTGNRSATNPNSSATGNGQFTDATWLQTIKNVRPELAQNMSDKQLLQLRNDPAFSQEMTAQYAQANAKVLSANGEPVNATSLALAHRFGPQGALSVMAASPDTKLADILPANVIKANPDMADKTAGDYVQGLSKNVGLDTIGQQQSPVIGDLSTYPKPTQSMVNAMLQGRQAPPSSFALRTPYWQNLLNIANSVDPTFDQTSWAARLGARKDLLGGGKGYQSMQAGNTAISHLGRLADQVNDVSNVQFPLVGNLVNKGVNAYEKSSGTPGVPAYNDTLQKLAQETTKLYRGTGGSESDIKEMQDNLSPDLSLAQKQAGIANTVHLIYGRLQSAAAAYNTAMNADFAPGHWLSPTARATIQRMGFDPDTGDKVATPQTAAPAAGWSIKKVP